MPSFHFQMVSTSIAHQITGQVKRQSSSFIIVPYVARVHLEKQIPDQKALLIMDNFKAHRTEYVLQPLEDNGVLVVFTSNRLQPLDLSINKAAKDFLWDKFRL